MIFCCEAMKDDEAIVARNVFKYASYSGYGFDLKFLDDNTGNSTNTFNVIAIDALDFSCDYDVALKLQLQSQNLKRELRKLLAGFSAVQNEVIDTGHWGCGAFGGNKYIKALLQMIAATITNNTLSFCCFPDETFYNSCKSFMSDLNCSIDDIWASLLVIDPNAADDLNFEKILKELKT